MSTSVGETPGGMGRDVRLGELLSAVAGLGLLRRLLADEDAVAPVLADLRRVVAGLDEPPWSLAAEVPELDPVTGYAAWSATYDSMANPLLEVEQPVVWSILESLPLGRALDA